MGLDAVVYKNAKYVFAPSEEEHLVVDPTTGQLYFDFDYNTDTRLDAEFLHRRLGNVSLISMLRDIVASRLGESSFLYSKVLYSGCHSGDVIQIEAIPVMLSELSRLKESVVPHEESTLTFINSMEALSRAAFEQNNPIVFE